MITAYYLCYTYICLQQCNILVKVYRVSLSNYFLTRIFTDISISLSQHLRQQESGYIIHTRLQLSANGLRYLRTLRVRASIHDRLFLVLTHRHLFNRIEKMSGLILYAIILQSLVFLINSPFPHFYATDILNISLVSSEVTRVFCRVP